MFDGERSLFWRVVDRLVFVPVVELLWRSVVAPVSLPLALELELELVIDDPSRVWLASSCVCAMAGCKYAARISADSLTASLE